VNPNDDRNNRTWRGSWTEVEKTLAMEVLNRMPAADRVAMDGVAMNKVDQMSAPAAEPASVLPPNLPEVLPAAPASTWHTIAHFRYRITTTGLGVVETKEFMVSRAALENPKKSLGESQADAQLTIAHEIGHVVEKQAYMARCRAMHDALRESHRTWNAYEKARLEVEAQVQKMASAQRQYDDLNQRVTAATAAKNQAYDAYIAAHQAAQDAVTAYNAAIEEERKGAKPDWPALKAALPSTKATLADKEKAWRDLATTMTTLAGRRDEFAKGDFGVANAKATELRAARDQLAAAAAATLDPFRAAKRQVAAVYDAERQQTHRLKNFVAMVTTAAMGADITPYAKKEWPDKPQEFFAESYAYFLFSPETLRRHSPALYDYFAGGGYRNDAG
jgi:hypothetical protein